MPSLIGARVALLSRGIGVFGRVFYSVSDPRLAKAFIAAESPPPSEWDSPSGGRETTTRLASLIGAWRSLVAHLLWEQGVAG